MKCKLIREMVGLNPAYDADDAEACAQLGIPYDVPKDIPYAVGTVIEHPDCHYLVGNGVATPDDEECAAKAGMTPEKFEAAKKRYDRLIRGKATGIKSLDSDKPDKKEKVSA